MDKVTKNSATEVYFGYLAAAFSTSDRSRQKGLLHTIDNTVTYNDIQFSSLLEAISYIQDSNLIGNNNIITVGNQKMLLGMKQDKGSYQVNLSKVDEKGNKLAPSPLPKVKSSVFEYSLDQNDQDLSSVYENTKFRYFPQEKKLGVDISTKVGGTEIMTIGGLNQRLWENQIDSLAKIILSDQDDKLIDLATGSGKSFVQAAMYIALERSGKQTIFAVPDETLKAQLYHDFISVLPDKLHSKLSTDAISRSPTSNFILTHDELLNYQWDDATRLVEQKKCNILVDEAHQPMLKELLKQRLKSLSDKTSLHFFTASPNEGVKELLNEAVATFTKNDKVTYGLVQKVEVITADARSYAFDPDDNSYSTAIKTALLGKSKKNSPAHTYFNELETTAINDKAWIDAHQNTRERLRWGVSFPIAEKGLILTDSIDILHNIGRIINVSSFKYNNKPFDYIEDKSRAKIIENDRIVAGSNSLLGKASRESEVAIIQKQREKYIKRIAKQTGISVEELKEEVDFRGVEQYQYFRVMHGVIENYIKMASGLNTVQLDIIRKDPASLAKLGQMLPPSEEQIEKYLQNLRDNGLPEQEITGLKSMMVEFSKLTLTDEQKLRLADNWSVDKRLHEDMQSFPDLWERITDYTKSHAFAISVNAESDKEHSVAKNIVRGWDSFARGQESKNEYWDYSIREMDALFKAGLIGTYISSEKTTGFSDPDLQSYAVLLDNKRSKINEPDNLLQAFGRGRGLNFNRTPFYLGVSKQGVEFSINVLGIERGDKFDLIQSIANYQKAKEENDIPLQIRNDFKKAIKLHLGRGNLGSNEQLLQLDYQRILNHHFNDVFNRNNHNIEKTKEIFGEILEKATKDAQNELYNDYDLGYIIQPLSTIVEHITGYGNNAISSFYNKKREIIDNSQTAKEKVYAEIISTYDLAMVTKSLAVLGGVAENIQKDLKPARQALFDHLPSLLTDEMNEALKTTIVDAVSASVNNLDKDLARKYVNEHYAKITQAMTEQLAISDPSKILKHKFDVAVFLKNSKSFPEFMMKHKIPLVYSGSNKARLGILELGINLAQNKLISFVGKSIKNRDVSFDTEGLVALVDDDMKQAFKDTLLQAIIDSTENIQPDLVKVYLDVNTDEIINQFIKNLVKQDPRTIAEFKFDIRDILKQHAKFLSDVTKVTINFDQISSETEEKYKIAASNFLESFIKIKLQKYISGEELANDPFSITNQTKDMKDQAQAIILNFAGEKLLPYTENIHVKEAVRYLFDSSKLSDSSFIEMARALDPNNNAGLDDLENQQKLLSFRDNLVKLSYAKTALHVRRISENIINTYENNPEQLRIASQVIGDSVLEVFKVFTHYHKIDIGRLGLDEDNEQAAAIVQNPKPALIDRQSSLWNLHDPYTYDSNLPNIAGLTTDRQSLFMLQLAPTLPIISKLNHQIAEERLLYREAIGNLDINRFRNFNNLPENYNAAVIHNNAIEEQTAKLESTLHRLGEEAFATNLRNLHTSEVREMYDPLSLPSQQYNASNFLGNKNNNNAAIAIICGVVMLGVASLVRKYFKSSKPEMKTKLHIEEAENIATTPSHGSVQHDNLSRA